MPVISVKAVRNRLPKLCPSMPFPLVNLCSNTSPSNLSLDNATRHFLKSPGGIILKSLRNLPELPPSSVTVTIAEILSEYSLIPFNSVDSPVPPPITTIRGPFSRDLLSYIAVVIS